MKTSQSRRAERSAPGKQQQPKQKGQPAVTSLIRGLEILRCFDEKRTTLTVNQIAELTGLPQTTAWRLCKTLRGLGYLTSVPNGTHLRPGLPLLGLGYSALLNTEFPELARPHLQMMANEFGAVCSVAIRDRLSMLYVQRCESTPLQILNLRIGSLIPISNSSHGWAYMAGLNDDDRKELMAILRKEQATEFKRAEKPFIKAYRDYLTSGVILNLGNYHPNVYSASAPILSASGSVRYTINCSAPPSILSADRLRRLIVPRLSALASRLSLSANVI
jgi:DNA-binding IclR family transcriptional regulator